MNSLDRIHLALKMTLLVIVGAIISQLHRDGASYATMVITGLSITLLVGIPADLWIRRLRRKAAVQS